VKKKGCYDNDDLSTIPSQGTIVIGPGSPSCSYLSTFGEGTSMLKTSFTPGSDPRLVTKTAVAYFPGRFGCGFRDRQTACFADHE
jgi:hypothetical protein